MAGVYVCTVAVRAEQYRVGMTHLLGRLVLVVQSGTTFAPHTVRCAVRPGDWVVEQGDRLVNYSGTVVKQGEAVVVLSDAEFRRSYRQIDEA